MTRATRALLLLTVAGCGRGPSPAPPAPEPRAAPASAIRLIQPEPVRHAPRVVATGTLEARQSSALALRVAGTLRRVAVRRGQQVREGTLLAALDDDAAAALLRQAEAAVAAGRAQLALADDALARMTRLRDQEGASEAQAVQARGQRELAAAQLAVAEAQREQARVNLEHHRLIAPFSGVVTRVPDGVGVMLASGTPVVTLVSTRELVLRTSVTQEEAAELRPGAPAAVTVPATGARTADARVEVVVPAVDPATNRVPVELTVPNPDGRFLPNAFARAELPRGMERDAWRVPAAALVARGAAYAVWVAGPDSRARTVPVRVLAEEGEAAVVWPDGGAWPSGLRVIAAPPLDLAEGAPVVGAGG